jgi:hypothetical protein
MPPPSRSAGKLIDSVDRERQRRQSLSKKLHKPNSDVGRAFKRLRDAGCDPDWLEGMLLNLKDFPFGRAKKFTKKDKRQFEEVIVDLESAAGQLDRVFLSTWFVLPGGDWGRLSYESTMRNDYSVTISLKDLPALLRAISKFLRNGLRDGLQSHWQAKTMTASGFLPKFLASIRKRTGGRPYWIETTELVNAAYGKSITPERLKQIAPPTGRSKVRVAARKNS